MRPLANLVRPLLLLLAVVVAGCGADDRDTPRATTGEVKAAAAKVTPTQAQRLWRDDDPRAGADGNARIRVADAVASGRLLAGATEGRIRHVLGRPVRRTRQAGKLVLGYQPGIFQRGDKACTRVLEFIGRDRQFRAKVTDFCTTGTLDGAAEKPSP